MKCKYEIRCKRKNLTLVYFIKRKIIDEIQCITVIKIFMINVLFLISCWLSLPLRQSYVDGRFYSKSLRETR